MKRIICMTLIVAALLWRLSALAGGPGDSGLICAGSGDTRARTCASQAPAPAPTVEELSEGYFKVLSGIEFGTAGVSLKTAIAASEACAFAVAHELYNPDAEALRANLSAAFEAMDGDGQAAFREGFDAVRAILDDSLEDWEAHRPLFDDAGIAEAMDAVMYDPLNRLAWENLRDQTLTLGDGADAA